MRFVKQVGCTAALGVAMLVGSGLSAPPVQSGYIVTLEQVGSNVVATGSGTIDLAGLRFRTTGGDVAVIAPSVGGMVTGPASPDPTALYTGFTGPTSFGSGGAHDASSGSGDTVGIFGFGFGNQLDVPAGYVSGSALSDSSTYDNQTFSSLGVTPGSYVWTWGSGATADSFTLDIVAAAAAPEPSSVLLLALPLGLVILLAAKHRRVTRNARVCCDSMLSLSS
jgi:hypothetical protein